MLEIISLEPLNEEHSEILIKYLNEDLELQPYLNNGNNSHILSKNEFFEIQEAWLKKNNAKLFAIKLNNLVIGSTSICKIDLVNQTANTGVWITSAFWNKGYGTQRLKLILVQCSLLGIKTLNCKIKKNNQRSKRIWEKFNASFNEDHDFFYASICLD